MNKIENFPHRKIDDINKFNDARQRFLKSPVDSPEEQNAFGHYSLICGRANMYEKIIQDSLLKGLPPVGEAPPK